MSISKPDALHKNVRNAAIEVSDAAYSIGERVILNPMSFSSTESRIGIVGRNGSGKSTLARLLCGLIEPTAGSVKVAGVEVAKDRQNAIRTVGMLFQNPDHQVIFPTVEEELGFGLEQLGYERKDVISQVRSALVRFNIEHWSLKSISTLSQGQRHLVCLIAVLLMQPKLIVLDEPYAGLDIPTIAQLSRFLHNVDATIVHVSHQIESLRDYNRILWIEEGELIMDGEPASVLQAFIERMQQIGESDVIV